MLRKIISFIAVIFWMAFILFLSSQPGEESNQLSTGITEMIVEVVEKVVPDANLDFKSINHFVRKNAHFFAYFVLGILVLNALRVCRMRGIKGIAAAVLICVIYAVSDEVHQLFVPGRGGQIKDVLIDSGGAVAGISVYALILGLIARTKRKA